jgi:hypothetical protein
MTKALTGSSTMKAIRNTLLATLALTAFSAVEAKALPISFDFSTVAHVATGSLTYTVGGLSVTAAAGSPTALVNARVNAGDKNKGGLGVTNSPGDNGAVDGFGFSDLLNLVFSHRVKLISARFAEVDKNDDYDFYTQAVFQWHRDLPYNFFVNNFGGPVGTKFGFGASESNDDYRLRSITVSPIPLPGSLVMLITGLLGVGTLARRKSKIN